MKGQIQTESASDLTENQPDAFIGYKRLSASKRKLYFFFPAQKKKSQIKLNEKQERRTRDKKDERKKRRKNPTREFFCT
jgi:hypothetical protein